MSKPLTFPPATGFQADLKARVDAYFAENKLSRGATPAMVLKTIFWLAFTWGSWGLLLSQKIAFPFNLPVWAATGFGLACIGFNIGHDAIHGAYSEKKWVNSLMSWSFDMMGASSCTWRVAHNIIHHTYTNIPGVDTDLEPGPTMAFYPQETKPWHRFQHYYAWFLYCFIGVIWVYIKDFDQIRRADPLTGKKSTVGDYVMVAVGKVLHIGLLLVVPLVVIDAPLWQIIAGYALTLAVGGFTLAIVFQLAHCIEGVSFPQRPTDANRMPEAWAEHQMRTTANFGNTPLATFICGGLDHQIEHHLMPRICHIHYPRLSPIVAQTAKEHGLPYVHNGSFFNAVGAHARTLKRVGRGEASEMSPVAVAAAE